MSPPTLLRIGTRKSPLALRQAEMVKDVLLAAAPGLSVEIIAMTTSGDQAKDTPLADIGGKGLFTKEIEEALLEHRVDIAVHSMKDMPTVLPEGLAMPALLPREDARDAFISPRHASLAALPEGAVVGTSSLRRQALLLHRRPDLKVIPFRGNVETRLRKLADGQAEATLLACAGLKRLGLEKHISSPLSVEEMLPAVAQGAIGIEARLADADLMAFLRALSHTPTETCVAAERAALKVLDGNCRTPIAAHATLQGETLQLTALLASPDGAWLERVERSGPAANAEAIGSAAGEALLSRKPKG
ncbi:MAG: hydroxymethylbilane synthase [Alphaproteobacteria bacterium]|nr:hydroxymethylbilane synthase [Alphaproteobacteria bacterium]